ncbi:MAG: type II CAAX prenyl endopeptidase Rce1 family protein [Acidobacteriota bacterium]
MGPALAVTAASAAAWALWSRGQGGVPLAASTAALALLFLPYFCFGLGRLDTQVAQTLRGGSARVWSLATLLLVPYSLYGWGTGSFSVSAVAKLALFVFLPTGLLFFGRGRGRRPSGWDYLAVLAIWHPFDFRWLNGIWVWPEGLTSYSFNTVLAVDLAVLLFVGFRDIQGVGFRFRLQKDDIFVIVGNFLMFSAVAIPVGLAIGFIEYHPRTPDVLGLLSSFVTIFLFIGLPEELLFRGLVQNFLEKSLARGWGSLLLAAVIFGAAHLNNHPAPNWAYFLLASMAGIFYGRAYTQSGGLLVPAALHALVDTTWRAFFR